MYYLSGHTTKLGIQLYKIKRVSTNIEIKLNHSLAEKSKILDIYI